MSEGNFYRDDVFSTSVRAGKRTYFFDVKATRGNDLFMTITESKRSGVDDNGNFSFEKHKIFLYKEDFEKFMSGLQESFDHIKQLQETGQYRAAESDRRPYMSEEERANSSSDVNFDDLG
ncbi:MAG: DUF3276 family protein [Flavobacteriales bacterium]|jgi:hypothetical protein